MRLLSARWGGKRFMAWEYHAWRKTWLDPLPWHIQKVFERLRRAGVIKSLGHHASATVYEWPND